MEGYTPPGRERDGYLSLERSQSCERTGRHAAQCHMFKDKSSQLKRPVYRCYARECHWKCQGRSCDIGSFFKSGPAEVSRFGHRVERISATDDGRVASIFFFLFAFPARELAWRALEWKRHPHLRESVACEWVPSHRSSFPIGFYSKGDP